MFDEVGDNVVVWGSQYPWPLLSTFPNELDNFMDDPALTDEQKKKVLWDNAASIFHIE